MSLLQESDRSKLVTDPTLTIDKGGRQVKIQPYRLGAASMMRVQGYTPSNALQLPVKSTAPHLLPGITRHPTIPNHVLTTRPNSDPSDGTRRVFLAASARQGGNSDLRAPVAALEQTLKNIAAVPALTETLRKYLEQPQRSLFSTPPAPRSPPPVSSPQIQVLIK